MNKTNLILKKEADELLYDYGLYNTLQDYSKREDIYITGSYALDLMVWRDLDIFIDIDQIFQDDIYDLVNTVMSRFRPVWLETKDTFNENTGCPKGYFLGFETLKVNNKLWNVDIWVTNRAHIHSNLDYINKLKSKLNDDSRKIIMDIKKQLIELKEYGTKYFSIDIYNGVINKGFKTLEDFSKLKTNEEGLV